jgi:predicted AlkP superfamily pyrophosphatase or phosphodiesterase
MKVYFSTVDTYGHQYGPDSFQMIVCYAQFEAIKLLYHQHHTDVYCPLFLSIQDAVKQIDDLLGTLMSTITRLNFPVDLVIVSDHGMAKISDKNVQSFFDATYTLCQTVRFN